MLASESPVRGHLNTMMAAYDKLAAVADGDRLPVVELRPFMAQEWRPCKSLPDFYERPTGTFSSLSAGSSKRAFYGFPDPEKVVQSARSEDVMRADGTVDTRREGQRAPRAKDTNAEGSHRDAFVTPPTRERSTVDEIRSGDSSNMQFSCFRRALSDIDVVRQQDMQISGLRMERTLPRPTSLLYAGSHWEYYKMPKSYSLPVSSPAQQAAVMDKIRMRINVLQDAYVDSAIYDAFDCAPTLPSITVGNAPMRWKRSRDEKQARQGSAKVEMPRGFQLGVANSLDVLRHYGTPVHVERQLTMQLKHTINQLRRTKDVSSALVSTSRIKQDFPAEDAAKFNLDSKFRENCSSRATSHPLSEGSRSLGGGYRSSRRFRPNNDIRGSPLLQRTATLPLIASPTQGLSAGTDGGRASESRISQTSKMPQISEGASRHVKTPCCSPQPASDGEQAEQVGDVPNSTHSENADSIDEDLMKDVDNHGADTDIQPTAGQPEQPVDGGEDGINSEKETPSKPEGDIEQPTPSKGTVVTVPVDFDTTDDIPDEPSMVEQAAVDNNNHVNEKQDTTEDGDVGATDS